VKKSTVAILVTLFIPGLGHVHLGHQKRGRIFIFLFIILAALYGLGTIQNQNTALGLSVILQLVLRGVAIYDIVRLIRRVPTASNV
jgi:hypothetical protein